MPRDPSPLAQDEPPADDVVPLPRARPFGAVRTMARIAGAAAIVAALSLFARETIRSHPPVQTAEGALSVTFTPSTPLSSVPEASRPRVRLRLEEPAASSSLPAGPAVPFSEDSLTQGTFEAIESPHLMVTVSQGDDDGPQSLFVTLARRAADGPGLAVTRTGERGRIDTKFGPMETIEATLVGASSRICTGFASLEPRPVRIDGWLCAPLGQPPERQALACTIDRLALDGPADAATEAVFGLAKARRDPHCQPAPLPVAAARDTGLQTGAIGLRRRSKK